MFKNDPNDLSRQLAHGGAKARSVTRRKIRVPLLLTVAGLSISWPTMALAGLNVALTASPDPVMPGGQINYVATVANDGGSDLTGVEVRLIIPGETDYFDDDSISGDCAGAYCEPGETAVYSLGLLSAGQSQVVLLPIPLINSIPDNTLIPNTATAVHDGGGGAIASVNVLVEANPGIALGITEDRDPVKPGESLVYTLTYANTSGVTLSDVTVRMPVPAGTQVVSSSAGGVVVGGEVRWNLGVLEIGSSGHRTIVLLVNQPSAFVLGMAEISNGSGTASAYAAATTAVQDNIPLTVALIASPDPVMPGDQINYVATVSNDGGSDLTGVEIRLIIPGETDYFDDDSISGDCAGAYCEPGETAVYSLGILPAGQSQVVLLPIPLINPIDDNTLIPNTATAVHDGGGGATASVNVLVGANPGLTLGIAEDRDPVTPGGSLDYTLTYANASDVTLSGVTLRMLASVGIPSTIFVDGFESGDTSAWSGSTSASSGLMTAKGSPRIPVATDGQEFLWVLGNLGPGDSGEQSITFHVQADAERFVSAVAGITDASETASARAGAATAVQTNIPLTVALTASPDPVMPGGQINYVATVSNTGGSALAGVEVRLIIPGETDYFDDDNISGDCAGAYCEPGETAVYTLGTLPAGQSQGVLLPIPLITSIDDNTLIPNTATAVHDGGEGATASVNVLVSSP